MRIFVLLFLNTERGASYAAAQASGAEENSKIEKRGKTFFSLVFAGGLTTDEHLLTLMNEMLHGERYHAVHLAEAVARVYFDWCSSVKISG